MGEAKRREKRQMDLIGIWCCVFVPLYLLFTGFADFSGISGWKTWTFYAPADSVLSRNKHVYYYLNDWLNVPWQEPDEQTLLSVSDSEAFRAMPLYPDDGSVVIEGDRVTVKLAWEYTPKKEYELQYENRK